MGGRTSKKTGGFIPMKVVLYSNENQECERVKQLLKSVKGEFLEYFLDEDFTQQQLSLIHI